MAPKRTRRRPEDHPDLVDAGMEPDGTITVDGGMEAEREHLERFFGRTPSAGQAKRPATKKPARRGARREVRP